MTEVQRGRDQISTYVCATICESRKREGGGGGPALTGMVDGLAEVGSGGLPHLSDDESSDLGWRVIFALSPDPCVAVRVRNNLERHIVEILLYFSVLKLATDKSVDKKSFFNRDHIDCR